MRVHGIDFSGSADPGEDIWLATGELDDGLRVSECRPASEVFGVSGREAVLDALRRFLAADATGTVDAQVAGVDCSFGLPRAVLPPDVAAAGWQRTLEWVGTEFADADGRSFQTALKDRARASEADGIELKRATDGPTGASSPYSFITRYQTLHGLRDVLRPLVAADRVAVPPMQSREDGPAVVEVYPAATLRARSLPDRKYKDDTSYPDAPERRKRILEGLLNGGVDLAEPGLRERVLADAGGDALDALVAAVATADAVKGGFAVDADRYDPVEGYIFV